MKKENYSDLNIKALEEKLSDTKKKLFSLRADVANRKLKNVKEITLRRKEIARVSTWLTVKKKEAQLEQLTGKETKE